MIQPQRDIAAREQARANPLACRRFSSSRDDYTFAYSHFCQRFQNQSRNCCGDKTSLALIYHQPNKKVTILRLYTQRKFSPRASPNLPLFIPQTRKPKIIDDSKRESRNLAGYNIRKLTTNIPTRPPSKRNRMPIHWRCYGAIPATSTQPE